MFSVFAILPLCAVVFGFLCFILQFIVLPSDEWGHFITRRITGLREESGHFGLWSLCSVKRPETEEKCVHPQDSPYDLPTYATAAGVSSIAHLILIGSFTALAAVRLIQIAKDAPDLHLGTKRLCIVKVTLALICVVVSISVSILASVGEGRLRQFEVYKGWAFWIQIAIISLDIVLLLVCAFENIQYWQIRMAEPPPQDPTDEFPETFVSPDYDLPPELREEKVVYVKDASVQSQLDGNGGHHLQLPPSAYGRYRDPKAPRYFGHDGSDIGWENRGAPILTISSHGSPHPRKKSLI